jgi:recombination protein RecA
VAEFDINYGEGISREGDILDLAVEYGVVDKRGAYYNYGDDRLAQGRENAKQFLRENPEVCAAIEQAVRSHFSTDEGDDLSEEPVEAAASEEVKDERNSKKKDKKTTKTKSKAKKEEDNEPEKESKPAAEDAERADLGSVEAPVAIEQPETVQEPVPA